MLLWGIVWRYKLRIWTWIKFKWPMHKVFNPCKQTFCHSQMGPISLEWDKKVWLIWHGKRQKHMIAWRKYPSCSAILSTNYVIVFPLYYGKGEHATYCYCIHSWTSSIILPFPVVLLLSLYYKYCAHNELFTQSINNCCLTNIDCSQE